MSGRDWLDDRAAQRAIEAFTNQDTAERDRVAGLAAQPVTTSTNDGRDVKTRATGRGWSM